MSIRFSVTLRDTIILLFHIFCFHFPQNFETKIIISLTALRFVAQQVIYYLKVSCIDFRCSGLSFPSLIFYKNYSECNKFNNEFRYYTNNYNDLFQQKYTPGYNRRYFTYF